MKKEEKEKAIVLRKQGKTYGEILREVSVAKSTLSLWLREVGLAKKQRQAITQKRIDAQAKGAEARRAQRVEISNKIYEKSESEIGYISPRELWLMGTMLYWAEGSKEKEYRRGVRLQFGNSDHFMMRVFVFWLINICHLSPDDLIFDLYIHENNKHRIDEVKLFWADHLEIPLSKLKNVYYKKHKPKTNRKNFGNMYNGLIRVNAKTSTSLVRQIAGWTRGVYKEILRDRLMVGRVTLADLI